MPPVTWSSPPDVILTLDVPPVSNEIVSASENLIAVFVSPVWTILSAIDTSPVNVLIPAFNPVVFPNILYPLAVTTPTESTLVTSS